ncbi:poly(A) polymerase [Plantactinospora solaniradicis]|uniref:Poly(A) polymerase n=1 Tax=Plantactinospora solaniradicis TaxID=1723736 RepID=A0ABW1KK21_9ACTN
MRTSEEIYHRIRWDPRFDPARFVLGVTVRGPGPARVPLPAFVPGGDVPWHRVLFIEADGEVVWDRSTGLDRIDSSSAGRVRDPRRLRAPFFTAGTPFRWDPLVGWHDAVIPAATTTGPAAAVRLRVLTWNVLWDRYDGDRIDTARRRPLLLRALERADADVIALQEVEAGLLDLLLRAGWVRSAYALGTDPAGRDVDDTGLLLLSRLPVREAGRHVLGPHKAVAAITVQTAAGPVVVAGTHLTSDHAERGAARRETELARLAKVLGGIAGDVILLGDFNDGGIGPAVLPGLRDAWSEARGPDDVMATFDPRVNPLAAVSTLSGSPARLDRVLLRGARLRAGGTAILGDAPATPDGLFISDHYGVVVEVTVGEDPTGGDGRILQHPDPTDADRSFVRRPTQPANSFLPERLTGRWNGFPAAGERHRIVLARRVVRRLRAALPEVAVHVVGSRRIGSALAGADLDLVLAVPGQVDLSSVETRVRVALPTATGVRQVVGARVPGLRLLVEDLDVDLVVVPTADVPAGVAVARRAELEEAAAIALSAVSDADAVLAAVDSRRSAFLGLVRQVKAWAWARGLDSAPFGGLPGLAWTVLAARTVCDAGDLPRADLLRHFFAEWATWDWRRPVTLRPGPPDTDTPSSIRILTPTAPVRSCTAQVGTGGRDLLIREFHSGWERVEAAGSRPGSRPDLLAPPPLRQRHAAWAVLTVRAVRGEASTVTLGRVRGRIRALLTDLERAGAPDAHAWPRPYENGSGVTRYAIGLGQAPPDPHRIAEVADAWLAGLPGASVEWVPGDRSPVAP